MKLLFFQNTVCFLVSLLLVACADDVCILPDGPELMSQLLQVKQSTQATQDAKVHIESRDMQHPTQLAGAAAAMQQAELYEDYEEKHVPLNDIFMVESGTGECLNFLHIPKNAGSTIEELMITQKGHVGWGEKDSHLTQCSHNNGKAMHGRKWHPFSCHISDNANRSGECSLWHVPPVYDPVVAASYNTCQTFCIVRDPLTRAISQHIYKGGNCTVASFVKTIRAKSQELEKNPFEADCHWVDQTTYVGRDPAKYCQTVLRFENLDTEFNTLMLRYGLPLSLEQAPHLLAGGCDLSKHLQDIPSETTDWIEKFFAADYSNFGYLTTEQKQQQQHEW